MTPRISQRCGWPPPVAAVEFSAVVAVMFRFPYTVYVE
jgi:hypothetical protein